MKGSSTSPKESDDESKPSSSQLPLFSDPTTVSRIPTIPRLARWLKSLHLPTPRLLTPDHIVLSTGPKEKSFTVHKKVLITRAPHFADGLRGGSYREAQEKKFEFPDVENDVIAVFVSWLYQNTLAEIPDNDTDSFDVTIRLYQFADSINLISLQNSCLDHVGKITKETNWTPKWREIAAHFDNSVPNDMMRILLVDLIAWSFMSSKQANVRSTLKDGLLNEDLVVDLFFRINEVGLSSGKALKPVRSKEWYHVQQSASVEQETPPSI